MKSSFATASTSGSSADEAPGVVRMRSIYSAAIADPESAAVAPIDESAASSSCGLHYRRPSEAAVTPVPQIGLSSEDRFPDDKDVKTPSKIGQCAVSSPRKGGEGGGDHGAGTLTVPESTHSLLFCEPYCSFPFWFAVAIICMSFTCLGLVFSNNVDVGAESEKNLWGIPANVSTSVRVAQYLSIFVTLLMEEEIPTGLFLLREMPYDNYCEGFSRHCYWRFVLSCFLRIANGYFFLINVLVVLIQADNVIEIFYDVLALQFVQQLDDIAFALAKIDVLGKRLQRACTGPAFSYAIKKREHRCRKSEAGLKALYFFNMAGLLAGMIVVTIRQMSGTYQCHSVSVGLGDHVWNPAFALDTTTGEYEEMTLIYSYFNGIYEQDGTQASRPVYKERRKSDRKAFVDVIPAEIKYCEEISAWVFTHENIKRSEDDDQSGCNWLLRSPETTEFDLSNVEGQWRVWTGVVSSTEVSISCNACEDNVDCNLNGVCVEGKCQCNSGSGAQYLGEHCETRLSNSCKSIISEEHNYTLSVSYHKKHDELGESLFQEYSRPVYTWYDGTKVSDGSYGEEGVPEGQVFFIMYTGSRWFGLALPFASVTPEQFIRSTKEFHAFWNKAYSTYTSYVSDPTDNPTPVGSDWYAITERGEQFGAFGALSPIQKFNQTGRGFFRCAGYYLPPKNEHETLQSQGSRRFLQPPK